MRVLFFESNPVWINLLPNGFKDAGHEVMVSGPLTQMNISEMINNFNPNLIITMGWGQEQTVEKQVWIRKAVRKAQIPHVFWSLEDPEFTQIYTVPLLARMRPDFVFTICSSMVEYFTQLGFKSRHMDYAYDPSIHYRVDVIPEYKSLIAVVANSYYDVLKNYPLDYRKHSLKTLITPLIEQNIPVNFWGNDWDKMKPFVLYDIPNENIRGYIPYLEANKVYSSADIVIGLQNYTTQLTQRTYEILGSEGLLITCDTPEIRKLFTPGQDLVVSSSPEETLGLVRYYLNNPDEREKIRKQGKLSVANHTYRHRAEFIIATLQEHGIL